MLGERTAEEIKMKIGSAWPASDEPSAEIRGRDLVSGLPKTIVISAEEIRRAADRYAGDVDLETSRPSGSISPARIIIYRRCFQPIWPCQRSNRSACHR